MVSWHPRQFRGNLGSLSTSVTRQGFPHVHARDWISAIYGLGYLHARDRGTQLLFARAVASGRAAELISDRPDLRETDRFLSADRSASQPGGRSGLLRFAHPAAKISAYCDGINDGVAAAGRSLPMWATGFRPRTLGCRSGALGRTVAELWRTRDWTDAEQSACCSN